LDRVGVAQVVGNLDHGGSGFQIYHRLILRVEIRNEHTLDHEALDVLAVLEGKVGVLRLNAGLQECKRCDTDI